LLYIFGEEFERKNGCERFNRPVPKTREFSKNSESTKAVLSFPGIGKVIATKKKEEPEKIISTGVAGGDRGPNLNRGTMGR